MSNNVVAICIFSIWLSGVPGTVRAQSHAAWPGSATLGGVIVDDTDGAVGDVDVTAMNTETGIRRGTNSGHDGTFLMPLLPPGTYVVTARRDGFAPLEVRNVRLHPTVSLMLRIRLRLGRILQSVDVAAAAGVVTTVSGILPVAGRSELGLLVTGELQRQLPLSPERGFADALFLAPGVTSRDGGIHVVHGAEHTSSIVLIDGADVTSNIAVGTALIRLSHEALDTVEVQTAGMEASAPITQSAVINVTTRSGSNALRGAAGVLFHPRGWMAKNKWAGTSRDSRLGQGDLALGGPLQRDRWWGFGVYQLSDSYADAEHHADTIALLQALVSGWSPVAYRAGGHVGFGKVTGRLGGHEVGAFYQRDTSGTNPDSGTYAEPLFREVTGGNAYAAHWATTWSDQVTIRFAAAYNDKTESLESVYPDRTAVRVHEGAFQSGGGLLGTGTLVSLNSSGHSDTQPASKLTLSGEATWYRTGLGTHELRAGTWIQPRLRFSTTYRFISHGVAMEEAVLRDPSHPEAGVIPFHRVIYDAPQNVVEDIRAHDAAVFAQDLWRPGRRVTIGAGVRVDWLKDSDRVEGRITRNTVAVGPRFSVSYELTPQTVVRGGWSRVHDSATAGRSRSWLNQVGHHDLYDVDLDGTFETDLYTAVFPGSSMNLTAVDVDRPQPFVNELTAGFRQQLPGRVAVDIGMVRREFRAMPTVRNTGFLYVDGVFQGFRTTAGQLPEVTANVWSYPVVTDLTAQVSRQSARIQVMASYTRNWRHLAGTWVPGDPASFLQPDAFPNNAGLGPTSSAADRSLNHETLTQTDAWIDHSLRVAAAYQAPYGLMIAGRYQVQSGAWSGPIITNIAEPDARFGPPIVTQGSLQLANPLATTLRFAYPTRGEGQLQLPTAHELSLRLGHRLALGGGVRLDTAIDVFNPFNRTVFLSFRPDANRTFSPAFGQGWQRQRPRSVQVSVRVQF